MATPAQRVYMIEQVRTNATQFIETVSQFKALGETFAMQEIASELVAEDFNGANTGLTPESIIAYMTMMTTLLSNMSVDDQKIPYTIKRA